MKKSMLNVITLALVLINLVLTVILTFSLVSTNNKTNNLIKKVAQIIDLDVGGISSDGTSGNNSYNVDDLTGVEVVSGDSNSITVTYTENGKTRYAVIKGVTIYLNKKAKDFKIKSESVNNGMNFIASCITNEALKYNCNTIVSSKQTIEENLLKTLQEQFQTQAICRVTISQILVQ